jgi:CRP/FNR family cyclic AMP-dependent transcriptional regulator
MKAENPPVIPDRKASRGALPTQAVLTKLLLAGGARRVWKRANSLLFAQGERSESIYFIVSGRVESSVLSPQGKEGTIALFAKGDFVGEASLTQQPLYLDSATTVTESDLLVLDSEQMRALHQENERVAVYFTNFLLNRTLDVQADLIDHLFNSSEKRLARVLLLLANFGNEGRLEPITNVTHDMLAQRVGTTRARISYFMNKFRRLGLIEYNGEIIVHSGLLNVVVHDARLTTE